jgi:hypothetical protein
MPDVRFSMTPVDKKPVTKRGRPNGLGKYAPILDAFLESEHRLVRVEDTGLNGYYLRVQLKKVCDQRGLDSVKLTVVNNELYLEKE